MRTRWLLSAALALCSCLHSPSRNPPARLEPPTLAKVAVLDEAALNAAVERFYRAADVATLREAVESAGRAAPGSALYHELAAQLARLEGDEPGRVEHLYRALLDSSSGDPELYLVWLDGPVWSREQQPRATALFEALSTQHPLPAVRARAADMLGQARFVKGDEAGANAAFRMRGPELPLAIIGSWDNDQGKGFDVAFPPEDEVDLSGRYSGALLEIGWRRGLPTVQGGRTPLHALLHPDDWSIAYAAGAFQVQGAGDYELRLASSDPLKVWVDGQLAFSEPQLDGWAFDQLVIPLRLEPGVHRVLLKSAQRERAWAVMARVTGKGGAQVAGLAPLPPDAADRAGPASGTAAVALEELTAARVADLPPESARRAMLLHEWTRQVAQTLHAVHTGDAAVKACPSSIVARYGLAMALWENQERGRASDLLAALDGAAGAELAGIRAMRGRFLLQQGQKANAGALLRELTRTRPERAVSWRQLAELLSDEGWVESECEAWERYAALAGSNDARHELAVCLAKLGFGDRARGIEEEILSEEPFRADSLRWLSEQGRDRGAHAEALERARTLVRAYPATLWERTLLADIQRRAGDAAGAEATLRETLALSPDSPLPYEALARLAYARGERDAAIEHWRSALMRNPDDDPLASRLDFLAPEVAGRWSEDVPDEAAMAKAVDLRKSVEKKPGADLAYLLDHEVAQLKPDGSRVGVVTLVRHAFNQAGRDKLTRYTVEEPGAVRVLHAYSVDGQGRRSEASRVRGKKIWFRGLGVGSTVVLQYRVSASPRKFLSRHLHESWSFQGPQDQRVLSQWILWVPSGTRLNEHVVGELERDERSVGGETRFSWTLRDVEPSSPEQAMPSRAEVEASVRVSTVPDWETVVEWEAALLQGAFRDSPELEQLAHRLAEGASGPAEKIDRIHAFVMEEIRYQRDYENPIAGVKPHPAPMVIERRYGDCKDKAVLFITLARKMGLTAHFALVRTRPQGPVARAVPAQQFNHAIVYLPEQPGVPEARFQDPTAEVLDLDVLRPDNPGTESLVFDPFGRSFEWRTIPFQSGAHHRIRYDVSMKLSADGAASGAITVEAKGRSGSAVRREARNPERMRKTVQEIATMFVAGATAGDYELLEVKDLRVPATIRLGFDASNAVRSEGEALRQKVPAPWSVRSRFVLAHRRHPLVLGVPEDREWTVRVELPEGTRAVRLPTGGAVRAPCLEFERAVALEGRRLVVRQTARVLCERILPEGYSDHREQVEAIDRILNEELVIAPKGRPGP